MNLQELIELKKKALDEAGAAGDPQALEAVRIRYLGRKGMLPDIMKGMKDVAADDRKAYGQTANALKEELQAVLDRRKVELATASAAREQAAFDCTLPGSTVVGARSCPHST